MSIKKTICLQEDVFTIAERNAKVMCNGNLSNYINSLIYNINKDEIDKLSKENELKKPKRCGVVFKATKTTKCEKCTKDIQIGEKICNARFTDEHESYVHVTCSKE
jgi:RNase P subunit RPR2